MISNPSFRRGKRVLVTGHTGLEGSWPCPRLDLERAVDRLVEWRRAVAASGDARALTLAQIERGEGLT